MTLVYDRNVIKVEEGEVSIGGGTVRENKNNATAEGMYLEMPPHNPACLHLH